MANDEFHLDEYIILKTVSGRQCVFSGPLVVQRVFEAATNHFKLIPSTVKLVHRGKIIHFKDYLKSAARLEGKSGKENDEEDIIHAGTSSSLTNQETLVLSPSGRTAVLEFATKKTPAHSTATTSTGSSPTLLHPQFTTVLVFGQPQLTDLPYSVREPNHPHGEDGNAVGATFSSHSLNHTVSSASVRNEDTTTCTAAASAGTGRRLVQLPSDDGVVGVADKELARLSWSPPRHCVPANTKKYSHMEHTGGGSSVGDINKGSVSESASNSISSPLSSPHFPTGLNQLCALVQTFEDEQKTAAATSRQRRHGLSESELRQKLYDKMCAHPTIERIIGKIENNQSALYGIMRQVQRTTPSLFRWICANAELFVSVLNHKISAERSYEQHFLQAIARQLPPTLFQNGNHIVMYVYTNSEGINYRMQCVYGVSNSSYGAVLSINTSITDTHMNHINTTSSRSNKNNNSGRRINSISSGKANSGKNLSRDTYIDNEDSDGENGEEMEDGNEDSHSSIFHDTLDHSPSASRRLKRHALAVAHNDSNDDDDDDDDHDDDDDDEMNEEEEEELSFASSEYETLDMLNAMSRDLTAELVFDGHAFPPMRSKDNADRPNVAARRITSARQKKGNMALKTDDADDYEKEEEDVVDNVDGHKDDAHEKDRCCHDHTCADTEEDVKQDLPDMTRLQEDGQTTWFRSVSTAANRATDGEDSDSHGSHDSTHEVNRLSVLLQPVTSVPQKEGGGGVHETSIKQHVTHVDKPGDDHSEDDMSDRTITAMMHNKMTNRRPPSRDTSQTNLSSTKHDRHEQPHTHESYRWPTPAGRPSLPVCTADVPARSFSTSTRGAEGIIRETADAASLALTRTTSGGDARQTLSCGELGVHGDQTHPSSLPPTTTATPSSLTALPPTCISFSVQPEEERCLPSHVLISAYTLSAQLPPGPWESLDAQRWCAIHRAMQRLDDALMRALRRSVPEMQPTTELTLRCARRFFAVAEQFYLAADTAVAPVVQADGSSRSAAPLSAHVFCDHEQREGNEAADDTDADEEEERLTLPQLHTPAALACRAALSHRLVTAIWTHATAAAVRVRNGCDVHTTHVADEQLLPLLLLLRRPHGACRMLYTLLQHLQETASTVLWYHVCDQVNGSCGVGQDCSEKSHDTQDTHNRDEGNGEHDVVRGGVNEPRQAKVCGREAVAYILRQPDDAATAAAGGVATVVAQPIPSAVCACCCKVSASARTPASLRVPSAHEPAAAAAACCCCCSSSSSYSFASTWRLPCEQAASDARATAPQRPTRGVMLHCLHRLSSARVAGRGRGEASSSAANAVAEETTRAVEEDWVALMRTAYDTWVRPLEAALPAPHLSAQPFYLVDDLFCAPPTAPVMRHHRAHPSRHAPSNSALGVCFFLGFMDRVGVMCVDKWCVAGAQHPWEVLRAHERSAGKGVVAVAEAELRIVCGSLLTPLACPGLRGEVGEAKGGKVVRRRTRKTTRVSALDGCGDDGRGEGGCACLLPARVREALVWTRSAIQERVAEGGGKEKSGGRGGCGVVACGRPPGECGTHTSPSFASSHAAEEMNQPHGHASTMSTSSLPEKSHDRPRRVALLHLRRSSAWADATSVNEPAGVAADLCLMDAADEDGNELCACVCAAASQRHVATLCRAVALSRDDGRAFYHRLYTVLASHPTMPVAAAVRMASLHSVRLHRQPWLALEFGLMNYGGVLPSLRRLFPPAKTVPHMPERPSLRNDIAACHDNKESSPPASSSSSSLLLLPGAATRRSVVDTRTPAPPRTIPSATPPLPNAASASVSGLSAEVMCMQGDEARVGEAEKGTALPRLAFRRRDDAVTRQRSVASSPPLVPTPPPPPADALAASPVPTSQAAAAVRDAGGRAYAQNYAIADLYEMMLRHLSCHRSEGQGAILDELIRYVEGAQTELQARVRHRRRRDVAATPPFLPPIAPANSTAVPPITPSPPPAAHRASPRPHSPPSPAKVSSSSTSAGTGGARANSTPTPPSMTPQPPSEKPPGPRRFQRRAM